MTLKEKIKKVSDDLLKEASRYPKMKTIDTCIMLNTLANQEFDDIKIADDFAIGFAEWLNKKNEFDFSKDVLSELLKIYKKENEKRNSTGTRIQA